MVLLLVLVPVVAGHAADGVASAGAAASDQATVAEAQLLAALRDPLITGLNVAPALEQWFAGSRARKQGRATDAEAAWQKGLASLHDLKPLPAAAWPVAPDATFEPLGDLDYPGTEGTRSSVVAWTVGGLREYGILMVPAETGAAAAGPGQRFPLLLYLHGQAFGVPPYALPWLARMVREGYAVVGPALRGEDLFAGEMPGAFGRLRCDGAIEDLAGEVTDALTAVAAAQKLPGVAPGKFGIIGHSFGAGVALLAAARSRDVACVVSYDAWFTNPFRFYYDRVRGGPNNWFSWEAFCGQPVEKQLAGLMSRSIVHHADRIECPLLLFIGGAYSGSVFHQSHEDLVARLTALGREAVYDVVPGGNHVFVLDYDSAAAVYAFQRHLAFLRDRLPPAAPRPLPRP